MNNEELSTKIVEKLMSSLERSTWADNFPKAYENLTTYQEDIRQDVERLLERHRAHTPFTVS